MDVYEPISVHQMKEVDEEKFEFLINEAKRTPFIVRGLNIGSCIDKWTPEYICQNGSLQSAVCHVSVSSQMNFIEKNFSYKKLPFKELVERSSSTSTLPNLLPDTEKEYYYFRSLGEKVRKDVSNFQIQFPTLNEDFKLPNIFPSGSLFSTVFRLSSKNVQLWTHYDVMDNILVEIKGRKRVVLFPPEELLNMYLQEDKSLVMDIDTPDLVKHPDFSKAKRYECILEEGDVLFIPALWFHNVTALDFCVAVNAFWKNLPVEMYSSKDVYGNKDLVAACRAQLFVNNAVKALEQLPDGYKDFYARKLMQSIKSKCLLK